jgi:hypothetical protein
MTTAPPTPGFARRTDGAPAVHADLSERGDPAGRALARAARAPPTRPPTPRPGSDRRGLPGADACSSVGVLSA